MRARVLVGPKIYNAETRAWIAAVLGDGGGVSERRGVLVDETITRFKMTSVWAGRDRIWLYAAENSQSSLRDIKNAALATATNGPIFTADRGYTGVIASSAYIATGYNPASSGQWAKNSASMGGRILTNRTVAGAKALMGNNSGAGEETFLMPHFTGSVVYGAINDQSFPNAPTTTALGSWAVSRTGANLANIYLNGAVFNAGVSGSFAPVSANIDILREGSTLPRYTDDQVASAFMGAGMTAQNMSDYDAVEHIYMQAIGAIA